MRVARSPSAGKSSFIKNILGKFIFDKVTEEEVYNGVLYVGEEEISEANSTCYNKY